MEDQLIFLIGAPRSGSTLLARMLGAHSAVHAPPEPHLLTPLAELGYDDHVAEAGYDPIIAQNAIRELVASLPRGEAQYREALRAYTDTLYGGLLEASGKRVLLDKTPAYALVLDFVAALYPKARYVVLTRHPMAVWSSYVDSFFDGDPVAAHQRNPLLERYVPAIARFLREAPVRFRHVRYESLVQSPREEMQGLCEFLDLPFEEDMVEYGRAAPAAAARAGLGDPVTVGREQRPTTRSVARWVEDFRGRPDALAQARHILARLLDPDLDAWGFSRDEIAAALDAVDASAPARRSRSLDRYALERRLLVRLRQNIHHNAFGKAVRKVRRVCDVLLR